MLEKTGVIGGLELPEKAEHTRERSIHFQHIEHTYERTHGRTVRKHTYASACTPVWPGRNIKKLLSWKLHVIDFCRINSQAYYCYCNMYTNNNLRYIFTYIHKKEFLFNEFVNLHWCQDLSLTVDPKTI